ncbi:MAG: hypothetical protein HWN79_18235 [Candidatus Lokiarchaeota archaeon]|nr:hypothetical protein [Candidatus Lokiarchaeota archaeon]
MRPRAIIGVMLIIIGIVIISIVAIGLFGVMAHDADNISDVLNTIESNSILFGVIFGIPIVVCFIPGYYLAKSD